MAKKITTPIFNKKQRQFLRGLAHHLKPAAMIGQQGLTPNLLLAVDTALTSHELVKIKIQATAEIDRHQAGNSLASSSHAALVQIIGKTIILFRPNPQKKPDQQIHLP